MYIKKLNPTNPAKQFIPSVKLKALIKSKIHNIGKKYIISKLSGKTNSWKQYELRLLIVSDISKKIAILDNIKIKKNLIIGFKFFISSIIAKIKNEKTKK